MPIIMFFCVIVVCGMPVFIIREWAIKSVLGQHSKTYARKIKKSTSLWKKISLLYLVDESSEISVKLRVVCYWLFCLIVLIGAGLFSAAVAGGLPHEIKSRVYFSLIFLDAIIWLYWRFFMKKNYKERKKRKK